MRNTFVRSGDPELKQREEGTRVFKISRAPGPAPSHCWGIVRATKDKLVSVPSLLNVIINSITANCFLSNTLIS